MTNRFPTNRNIPVAQRYPIDKNIPIPSERSNRLSHSCPFDEMKVGDSFFIDLPVDKIEARRLRTTFSAMACAQRKKNGHRFTSRSIDGGLRIWRIV